MTDKTLLEALGDVKRSFPGSTQGDWWLPHMSRPDTDCMCGYVFSDLQSGMGSILTIDHSGENEPLSTAMENGRLVVGSVNFIRTHTAEIRHNALRLKALEEAMDEWWAESEDHGLDEAQSPRDTVRWISERADEIMRAEVAG